MSAPRTDRRSVLRGLASLPLIGGGLSSCVPGPVFAAPIGADHPDADLIDHAGKVVALAARERLALNRRCAVEEKAQDLHPPRPRAPSRSHLNPVRAEETVDGGQIIRVPPMGAFTAYEQAKADHAAAVTAWEAECAAIDERSGLPAADKLYARVDRRLAKAGSELGSMTPTSPAGALAKARGCIATLASYEGCPAPDWLDGLTRSVVRDVVAIGGAA